MANSILRTTGPYRLMSVREQFLRQPAANWQKCSVGRYYNNIPNDATSNLPICPPVIIMRTISQGIRYEEVSIRLAHAFDAAREAESYEVFRDQISLYQFDRRTAEEQGLGGELVFWIRPGGDGQGDLRSLSASEFYAAVHPLSLWDALASLEAMRGQTTYPANLPPAIIDHINSYPGPHATRLELSAWGMKYLELVFSYEGDAFERWGVDELVWIAAHPLAEIIRRPLISRWHFELLAPTTPPILLEPIKEWLFFYAATMGTQIDFRGDSKVIGKHLKEQLLAIPEDQQRKFFESLQTIIVERVQPIIQRVIERAKGVTKLRTEVYHMLYGGLTPLRDSVTIAQDQQQSLMETLRRVKFWVIEDEAECVERFMPCQNIEAHHPGRILKTITDGQYEFLIVNLLIPGTEGGLHFIQQLRAKANREGWKNFPRIVVLSSSVQHYHENLEELRGEGIIYGYVNKIEYDPKEFISLVKTVFPDKFQ